MTTLIQQNWACEVCGHVSEQTALASTSAFGPSDFDTRPPELERSTLGYELARCPECGFVGSSYPDLDVDPTRAHQRETVASEPYRKQLADPELPGVANDYLCRSLIEAGGEHFAAGAWLALSAAWVCDDAGNEAGARRCRECALELWAQAEEARQEIIEGESAAAQLLAADLERRIGQFEAARDRCHRGLSGRPKEPIRSYLEFELELISREDTAAHSLSEVAGGLDE